MHATKSCTIAKGGSQIPVLSFSMAKAKEETKILSVHKIKRSQLLRRTPFSGTETWEKFLAWVLIKGTLCDAVNNVLKNIFSSMGRNYNVQMSCKFRLTEKSTLKNFFHKHIYSKGIVWELLSVIFSKSYLDCLNCQTKQAFLICANLILINDHSNRL